MSLWAACALPWRAIKTEALGVSRLMECFKQNTAEHLLVEPYKPGALGLYVSYLAL